MQDRLTDEEKKTLLRLARSSLEAGVRGQQASPIPASELSPRLRDPGASFATLTINGQLRGCIGALEPYQSLADDVREHALAAALEDPRFPPVRPEELGYIQVEISRLTLPEPMEYTDANDLLSQLHPNIDGVILRDGMRRATFLPQVWEKIPDKETFLDNLCMKMGSAPDTWRKKHLEVLTYQVEEFHE
ncbi:MAG: AmmeMemoRadiSam system protein A [Anaerolineae bacterium]|jgi:AmmeMemoRadiSam system protein A